MQWLEQALHQQAKRAGGLMMPILMLMLMLLLLLLLMMMIMIMMMHSSQHPWQRKNS